jgi:hypothetical protein
MIDCAISGQALEPSTLFLIDKFLLNELPAGLAWYGDI